MKRLLLVNRRNPEFRVRFDYRSSSCGDGQRATVHRDLGNVRYRNGFDCVRICKHLEHVHENCNERFRTRIRQPFDRSSSLRNMSSGPFPALAQSRSPVLPRNTIVADESLSLLRHKSGPFQKFKEVREGWARPPSNLGAKAARRQRVGPPRPQGRLLGGHHS